MLASGGFDPDELSQVSEQEFYDPAKYAGPTGKQESAMREAMDRYLTEMEIRASEAMTLKSQIIYRS